MPRRYSSSTNASRVAGGRGSSRPPLLAPEHNPSPLAVAEEAAGPQQRTFFLSGLSVRSGETTGRAVPETFYSEATPPGSSHGSREEEEEDRDGDGDDGDGWCDHVAPPAPIPMTVPRTCGMPRRRFWALLWAAVVVVAVAVAVPVAVVFGLRGRT